MLLQPFTLTALASGSASDLAHARAIVVRADEPSTDRTLSKRGRAEALPLLYSRTSRSDLRRARGTRAVVAPTELVTDLAAAVQAAATRTKSEVSQRAECPQLRSDVLHVGPFVRTVPPLRRVGLMLTVRSLFRRQDLKLTLHRQDDYTA